MSGKTYAILWATLVMAGFVLSAFVQPAMNAHVAAQLEEMK